MTSQELETFSQLLNQEETQVKKELGEVAIKDPATPNGYQPKPGDYGGDMNEDEVARQTTDSETNTALEEELKHRLDEILKAQEKLKTGRYGLCDKCGANIPAERLQALPMTPFCINCAE